MDRTLIANTTILDGSGATPFSGDVLVEGQRIVAVQRGGGLPRGDARVIDGAGATLMPGLVEPHGHVSYPDAASNADFTRLPPEEHVLVTMRNAKTMLDCGYTSVLSGAAAKPRLDIVIRNEINAGRIAGPRYLANGPEITVTGGLGDENELHLPHLETPTFAWVADGPDEIRKICRLLVREGTDLFKLNVSGHAGPTDSRTDRAVMTDVEVAAAMEIARANGVRVCAHAGSDLDNEVGGALVGQWRADHSTGRQYVVVEAAIRALHSYEIPEIIAVPVELGLPEYLEWVLAETMPAAS